MGKWIMTAAGGGEAMEEFVIYPIPAWEKSIDAAIRRSPTQRLDSGNGRVVDKKVSIFFSQLINIIFRIPVII